MFAALRYLILAILLISLLRHVIGFLARLFLNTTVGPQRPAGQAAPHAPAPAHPEALKRDPVCGTFVAPSTAVQKQKGGQMYYFCSPECRDKF
ncbi:MAG: YHS domain-containing protein [Acidobacteriota bacterium]